MQDLAGLLPLILIFVVFYFLIIRPQQKRAKEHKAMIDGLKLGDEVVTAGGILGKIRNLNDNFVHVEIADNTEVKVQRGQILQLMPKGTMKDA
jgi:preprotein translocase subunit YajC